MNHHATALATDASDDVDAVYRLDTVPPPASGDAYSAPTQMRELPESIIALLKTMKRDASEGDLAEAVELAAQLVHAPAPSSSVPAPTESGIVPRIYAQWEEGDGDEDPPTRLCGDAVADVLAQSQRSPPRQPTIRPAAPPPAAPPTATASGPVMRVALGAATALLELDTKALRPSPLPIVPEEEIAPLARPVPSPRVVLARKVAYGLCLLALTAGSAGVAALLALSP